MHQAWYFLIEGQEIIKAVVHSPSESLSGILCRILGTHVRERLEEVPLIRLEGLLGRSAGILVFYV